MADQEVSVPCAFTRRAFCTQAGGAATFAALATMLQGCSGNPMSPSNSSSALPTLNGSVVNGALLLTIDPASALGTVGGAALVQSPGASFLVARTAQDTFTALTAVCTHEGCTVSEFQSQTYVCPCHGSKYNTSGTVLTGPATRALRQFATQFANNVLTITL